MLIRLHLSALRSKGAATCHHFLINAKTETTLNEVNSVLETRMLNSEMGSIPAVKGLELLGFRTLVALLSGQALDCALTALKENLDRK